MATKESSNVLSRAVNVLGTPYRWGGSSPSKGFDCSGLVKYAFNDATFDLPRTSNAMASGHGEKVDRKDLKPGDLIFFNIKSRRVNHVAIYLGNDRFIHAPRRGKSVSIDTLKKPYWEKHYVVAKRVLPKEQNSHAGRSALISNPGTNAGEGACSRWPLASSSLLQGCCASQREQAPSRSVWHCHSLKNYPATAPSPAHARG